MNTIIKTRAVWKGYDMSKTGFNQTDGVNKLMTKIWKSKIAILKMPITCE